MTELKKLADLPVIINKGFYNYVTSIMALVVDVTRPVFRPK